MGDKALDRIMEVFQSGDIPAAIAVATFPAADVPMANWSYTNRILCALMGTADARGYRQWQEVGRFVRKGVHAIHILAPRIITKRQTDEKTGEETKRQVCIGFLTVPVFRAEDTDGQPLDYENHPLPAYPLADVARAWGITVTSAGGQFGYLGYYCPKDHRIALATPEEKTFYHELAHAAHDRILTRETGSGIKRGQVPEQEIIAELCACAIAYMTGKELPRTIGNTWEYICHYSDGKNPLSACLHVLGQCEKVITEIMTAATTTHAVAA